MAFQEPKSERNRSRSSGWTPINTSPNSQTPQLTPVKKRPSGTTAPPHHPDHSQDSTRYHDIPTRPKRTPVGPSQRKSGQRNQPAGSKTKMPQLPYPLPSKPQLQHPLPSKPQAAALSGNPNANQPTMHHEPIPLASLVVENMRTRPFDRTACPPDKLFTVDTVGCAAYKREAMMELGEVTVEKILSQRYTRDAELALEKSAEGNVVVGRLGAIDSPALDADHTMPSCEDSAEGSDAESDPDDMWM